MNKKIFVSSSGIKIKDVEKNIKFLAKNGIKNIELSGGCTYSKNLTKKLISLKHRYNLEFTIHNYFPPPKKNFVLNLGSCNTAHYNKTVSFYKKTINLCKKIGVKHYAMHAGFLIDIKPSELGNKIEKRKLYSKEKSINQLIKGYKFLKKYSKGKVNLYLENNVITKKNLKEYGDNPLLLTCYSDYLKLKKKFKFNLLLDLAHLKVSSRTLKKNFLNEVKKFQKYTKYAHISGNDGHRDLNKTIQNDSQIKKSIKLLKNISFATLEVYEEIKLIKQSKKICEELFYLKKT